MTDIEEFDEFTDEELGFDESDDEWADEDDEWTWDEEDED